MITALSIPTPESILAVFQKEETGHRWTEPVIGLFVVGDEMPGRVFAKLDGFIGGIGAHLEPLSRHKHFVGFCLSTNLEGLNKEVRDTENKDATNE